MNERRNNDLLTLFKELEENFSRKLFEETVGKIISFVLTHEPLNGDLEKLIETRKLYHKSYNMVMKVVYARLEIPEGVSFLLDLYLRTKDRTLKDRLQAIRNAAYKASQFQILEEFAKRRLSDEFTTVKLSRRQRRYL